MSSVNPFQSNSQQFSVDPKLLAEYRQIIKGSGKNGTLSLKRAHPSINNLFETINLFRSASVSDPNRMHITMSIRFSEKPQFDKGLYDKIIKADGYIDDRCATFDFSHASKTKVKDSLQKLEFSESEVEELLGYVFMEGQQCVISVDTQAGREHRSSSAPSSLASSLNTSPVVSPKVPPRPSPNSVTNAMQQLSLTSQDPAVINVVNSPQNRQRDMNGTVQKKVLPVIAEANSGGLHRSTSMPKLSGRSQAQDIPPPPVPPRKTSDESGVSSVQAGNVVTNTSQKVSLTQRDKTIISHAQQMLSATITAPVTTKAKEIKIREEASQIKVAHSSSKPILTGFKILKSAESGRIRSGSVLDRVSQIENHAKTEAEAEMNARKSV